MANQGLHTNCVDFSLRPVLRTTFDVLSYVSTRLHGPKSPLLTEHIGLTEWNLVDVFEVAVIPETSGYQP